MKRYKVKEVIELLKKDGWYLAEQESSHRQFKHLTKTGKVTVNGKPSDTVMKKAVIKVDWDKNYGAVPANESIACVVTGKTLDEIKERMEFSLSRHLASMRDDGDHIPEEFSGSFELEYHLSARALLRYTDGLIPRKAIAKAANINLQQLSHYASGWRNPRPEMERRISEGVRAIGRQLITVSM